MLLNRPHSPQVCKEVFFLGKRVVPIVCFNSIPNVISRHLIMIGHKIMSIEKNSKWVANGSFDSPLKMKGKLEEKNARKEWNGVKQFHSLLLNVGGKNNGALLFLLSSGKLKCSACRVIFVEQNTHINQPYTVNLTHFLLGIFSPCRRNFLHFFSLCLFLFLTRKFIRMQAWRR